MTGVHGANRLASNSLLEALVFSDRASRSSAAYLRAQTSPVPAVREWDDTGTFNSEEWILVLHNRREIQQIMWDYVGIVRSDLRLERAGRRMELIRHEVEGFYKKTKVTEGLIELRNIALCADLIIRCAMKRKESRGLQGDDGLQAARRRASSRFRHRRLSLRPSPAARGVGNAGPESYISVCEDFLTARE